MAGPLAGIKILDLSSVLMGPFATSILGDHGAEVIKIESPAGDTTRWLGPCRSPGMGPLFLALNRSKRSIVLDLKRSEGRDVVLALAAEADVLLHNLRPASMDRLGLSYEAVSGRNPRIIYCGVYGYGEDGPYADRPAYDDLIQGAVALPSLHARAAGSEPRYVPVTIADRTVGLNAVYSVSMALFDRERTGRGQRIDVPMFETMVQTTMGDHLYGETFDPPLGPPGYVRLLASERRPYPTRDGYVCALVYNDGHWTRFLDHIGRPDLKSDPRFKSIGARNAHIDEVYGFLGEVLLTDTTQAWLDAFETLDIPATPLHTPDSLLRDPHLEAIDFFPVVDHPTEGRIRSMRIPAAWSGTAPEPSRLAPRLGQHSVEVLREAGYRPDEIEQLIAAGVVVDGRPAE